MLISVIIGSLPRDKSLANVECAFHNPDRHALWSSQPDKQVLPFTWKCLSCKMSMEIFFGVGRGEKPWCEHPTILLQGNICNPLLLSKYRNTFFLVFFVDGCFLPSNGPRKILEEISINFLATLWSSFLVFWVSSERDTETEDILVDRRMAFVWIWRFLSGLVFLWQEMYGEITVGLYSYDTNGPCDYFAQYLIS